MCMIGQVAQTQPAYQGIVAYRAFSSRLNHRKPTLRSTARPFWYTRATMKNWVAPGAGDSNGFWTYKELRHVQSEFRHAIHARVLLTGNVIEHALGYRGEQLTILALILPPKPHRNPGPKRKDVRALAKAYGVKVEEA